ncbi:MAG: hypothetical protein KDC39_04365 [Actinobacteria bacterium]|nr:hypothetical protein [Actinomycetota bacterium]
MTNPRGRRALAPVLTLTLLIALFVVPGSPADAATEVRGSKATKLLKRFAGLAGVRDSRIKVRKSGVTIFEQGITYRVSYVGVHRSAVAPNHYRIDLKVDNNRPSYLGVVRVSGSRMNLIYWGSRYNIESALCRMKKPNAAVVADLDLGPVQAVDGRKGACRHKRSTDGLSRDMSASELASVRSRYKPVWNGRTLAPPQTPNYSEVTPNCDWDRDRGTTPPSGSVSRTDPRFGVVSINCITGSVGGVAALNPTELLVSRKGRSGAFTQLVAHVFPSWTRQSLACDSERRFGLAALTRVGLDFCMPYPATLKYLR